MQEQIVNFGRRHILYDGDLIENANPELFDLNWWRDQDRVIGEAQGRGATWFVGSDGGEWVLRHYRRGGMAAAWSRDGYLFLGRDTTRAFGEWRLLAKLHHMGLAVPRPVAAQITRGVLTYRADILVERIPGAEPLAQLAARQALTVEQWQSVGRAIRSFHDAQVFHHDLNAHNILLSGQLVTLIDFDQGRLRPYEERWKRANLSRLRRSLNKLSGMDESFAFSPSDWGQILTGYGMESSG